MDSSFSPKDEIYFLRLRHYISTGHYNSLNSALDGVGSARQASAVFGMFILTFTIKIFNYYIFCLCRRFKSSNIFIYIHYKSLLF